MRNRHFMLASGLLCAAACLTSCSDEPGSESMDPINSISIDGVWYTEPISASTTYPIMRNGWVINDKGKKVTTYRVTNPYFLTVDLNSYFHDSGKFFQYFLGKLTKANYTIKPNETIYGGKAMLSLSGVTSPMGNTIKDIEVMSYDYNKKKNWLRSASVMATLLSRDELEFIHNDPATSFPQICTITPTVSGVHFETWEEDENGNIYNYIYHGSLSKGDNENCRFAAFSPVVYCRASNSNNTKYDYGSWALSPTSATHALIADPDL